MTPRYPAPRRARRQLAAALAAGIFGVTAAFATAPAKADPLPGNCVQQYWLYGLRGTTRTICDGPMAADGSWQRAREFYGPAFWSPGYCSYYYCSLGYPVAAFDKVDVYRVTPDTVLPDEPGYVGIGAIA